MITTTTRGYKNERSRGASTFCWFKLPSWSFPPLHLSNTYTLRIRIFWLHLELSNCPFVNLGLRRPELLPMWEQTWIRMSSKLVIECFYLNKQAYSTYITTPTTFCTRIPDYLSFNDALSMLMPYVTRIHSLVNIGCLEKGQVS